MSDKMSIRSRYELANRVSRRYRAASTAEKTTILDEFVQATGYSRKHAISLLNRPRKKLKEPGKRARKPKYGKDVRSALVELWEAAHQICSKRLAPFLPDLIDALERHGRLILQRSVKEQLLCMSPSTMDRLLLPNRRAKGFSVTRSGPLLKRQIPVRTYADWDEIAPGFFEADLVAHCGDTIRGIFLHTLVLTDVYSGWTEPFCLLYRREEAVIQALDELREILPFPLEGLDTDNGTEFINRGLTTYCAENQITFTRSRPYRKNDQCHVEEKNGSVVRRTVGYNRFEGQAAQDAFNRLYSVLRLYVNFFQPSMKLLYKERKGSQVRKKYSKAKTPFRRVIESGKLSAGAEAELKQIYLGLDPHDLLLAIEQLQDELISYSVSYHEESQEEDQKKPRTRRNKRAEQTTFSAKKKALDQLVEDCPGVISAGPFREESRVIAQDGLEKDKEKKSRSIRKGVRRKSAAKVSQNSVNTSITVAETNVQRFTDESPSFRAKRVALEQLRLDLDAE